MGTELTIGEKQDLVKALETHELGDILKPLIKEIHLFDTYIAGTSYLSDKSVLDDVKVEDKLTLRREDNKFDDNAIEILAQDGRKLGYVPEKDNIIFARLMDAGKLICARIKGVSQKGSFTQISIGIYLVDF
ncbi:MAG: restriction endonuclease [Lachnospiraceae bacterium]|nr:restriction endonuclease [Lachnospiraceae bacterium]